MKKRTCNICNGYGNNGCDEQPCLNCGGEGEVANTHPTTQQVMEDAVQQFRASYEDILSPEIIERTAGDYRKTLEQVAHTTAQEVLDRVEVGVPECPPYPVEEGVTEGRNEAMQHGAKTGFHDCRTATLSHITKVREDYKGKENES